MDSDELFENFNFNHQSNLLIDTHKKKEDSKIFLSKKRANDHEKDQYSNSENNKREISNINEYNSIQSKEKKEDLLLSKEIQSIKDSILKENNSENNIENEDNEDLNFKINNIPDKEVQIITEKFEGGFHELIYPINLLLYLFHRCHIIYEQVQFLIPGLSKEN